MDSAELARTIQSEARPLIEGLYTELRSNFGTSHYHRLSNDDLFRRGQAVYLQLADWLASHDEAAIRRLGENLGKQRFAEGIPLGQVVLALILEEKHLWAYLKERTGSDAYRPDERLHQAVSEYFQKTIYSTARGFEESLALSNQRARRSAPEAAGKVMTKADAIKAEGEMGVSRGGDVGEQGG